MSLFILNSCGIIGPDKSKVCFTLINNTSSEIDWVQVYLQDTEDETRKKNTNLIEFYRFENITIMKEIDSKTIDIENFSKTGFGYYVVKIKFKDATDTLMPYGTEKYAYFKFVNDIAFLGSHTSKTNIKIESKSKAKVYLSSN